MKKKKFQFKASYYGYLFIAPALISILVFALFPILKGFWLSFTNSNGINQCEFVGLQNYQKMLVDTEFHASLLNTFIFVLGTVPAIVILSLVFAYFLNKKLPGRKFFRSVYFLPAIASTVSIAMIWKWLFNESSGLLNMWLNMLGLDSVHWLSSSKWSMTSVIIMNVWKNLGTNIVIMLAALQGVPHTLYEAISLETNSKWKSFFHITLPMVSPTVFLVSIMTTISAFQVFEQVMCLTNGGPGNSTTVAVLYIYRQAFENFRMGYASTLAYVLFFIILIITLVQWYGQKYWVHAEG